MKNFDEIPVPIPNYPNKRPVAVLALNESGAIDPAVNPLESALQQNEAEKAKDLKTERQQNAAEAGRILDLHDPARALEEYRKGIDAKHAESVAKVNATEATEQEKSATVQELDAAAEEGKGKIEKLLAPSFSFSPASSFEDIDAVFRNGKVEGFAAPQEILGSITDARDALRLAEGNVDSPVVRSALGQITRQGGLRDKVKELLAQESAKYQVKGETPAESQPIPVVEPEPVEAEPVIGTKNAAGEEVVGYAEDGKAVWMMPEEPAAPVAEIDPDKTVKTDADAEQLAKSAQEAVRRADERAASPEPVMPSEVPVEAAPLNTPERAEFRNEQLDRIEARVNEVARQNEELRRENADLRRQLAEARKSSAVAEASAAEAPVRSNILEFRQPQSGGAEEAIRGVISKSIEKLEKKIQFSPKMISDWHNLARKWHSLMAQRNKDNLAEREERVKQLEDELSEASSKSWLHNVFSTIRPKNWFTLARYRAGRERSAKALGYHEAERKRHEALRADYIDTAAHSLEAAKKSAEQRRNKFEEQAKNLDAVIDQAYTEHRSLVEQYGAMEDSPDKLALLRQQEAVLKKIEDFSKLRARLQKSANTEGLDGAKLQAKQNSYLDMKVQINQADTSHKPQRRAPLRGIPKRTVEKSAA